MTDPIDNPNNVRTLDVVFRWEAELEDQLLAAIHTYYGRLSVAQVLGLLEVVKSQVLRDAYETLEN